MFFSGHNIAVWVVTNSLQATLLSYKGIFNCPMNCGFLVFLKHTEIPLDTHPSTVYVENVSEMGPHLKQFYPSL